MSAWAWVGRLVATLESGEQMSPDQFRRSIELARRQAAREEREACAKLVEDWHPDSAARDGDFILADAVTRSIRARGDR